MQFKVHSAFALLLLAPAAHAACTLDVRDAWIRAAPPGAMMLAGYATLANSGAAPVAVRAVDAAQFGAASMHESYTENGVAKMRPMGDVLVAPNAAVNFAPGGKHFMLMRPAAPLAPGAKVELVLHADCGDVPASFVVRDAP